MAVVIEHDISGHIFIVLPQEYVPNDIIGCIFLLLPKKMATSYGSILLQILITIE